MSIFIKSIVGFLAAVLASMGLGGGGVLLVYLSIFTKTPQLKAQGINLLFFLPVGAVALLFHIKNRLIRKKEVLLTITSALPGAVLGAWLSAAVNDGFLRRAFAAFLLIVGVRELFGALKRKGRCN